MTESPTPDEGTRAIRLPGPTVGVVGGGQLGRMLAEAAAPLGVETVVLDPTADPPAAPVARDAIAADFDDPDAVRELAARVDVLTYEIELADADLLERVRDETGTPVHPDPASLRITGDKLVEKETLAEAGVPVPPFRRVDDADDLRAAVETFGRVMLKARSGGYDGRGNVPVGGDGDPAPAEALDVVGAGDGGAVAEAFVDYRRELAVMGVRGVDGPATFPVTETIHREEILRETVAPAVDLPGEPDGGAPDGGGAGDPNHGSTVTDVVRAVLELLSGRGVFGIELFEAADGEVLVNEIAPRPHNSGHWTIEGTETSQFEQHVRAVLGWPLGSTAVRGRTATANVLGDVDEPRPAELRGVEAVLASPGAHLHWYGKREARPLRKMGHLTVTDRGDGDDSLARARDLRDGLTFRSPGDEPPEER